MPAGSDRMREATSACRLSGTGRRAGMRSPSRSRSRAISSAYSGFPPDACAIRTSIGRGNVLPSCVDTTRCNEATESGPSSSRTRGPSGSSRTREPASPDRTERIARTRSAGTRRSANSSADVEGRSSQWKSSTATTTARSSASCRRSDKNAVPNSARAGRPVRLRAQQRDLERLALHLRNRPVELLRHACQQVGEPGERELRLGLGRPRCQHRRAPGARARDRLVPDRGLADPGLADDREDGVAIGAPIEERLDRRELGLAPDDAGHAERVRPRGRSRPESAV